MIRRVSLYLLLLCCLAAAPISARNWEQEAHCVITTVYGEARGESLRGQAMVAQVIRNRVEANRWPGSYCGVVRQPRQFDGYKARGRTHVDSQAWARAAYMTANVLNQRLDLGRCGRATHFHATYVRPAWSYKLTRLCQVGNHIFYR